MGEADLMREIQVESSKKGVRLFRNQVGKYELKDGRWLTSGLAVGSSDLIGWKPIVLQGMKIAVFCAVEVKSTSGLLSPEQGNFLSAVRSAGGIATVAHSTQEALSAII